jgi:O-antigen/teichoic acid export membrane protein
MAGRYEDLARKASVGVVLVATRSIIAQAIGLVGLIILTRELTPRDFGTLAVGLTIVAFATAFADAGLAAGLIRSPREPSRRELGAALGLQIVAMGALALVAGLVLAPFGRVGGVSIVMLCSLPIMAWQVPARVVLERGLEYRAIAAAELAQTLVYWLSAVAFVLLGYGVYGVASATVAGAAVGSLVLWSASANARVAPVFSVKESRGLMRFGIQFQMVNFANLARDQGLNVAVGAILGLPALGVWNVASRVLQVPMMLFNAVWRVSYPAMARIVREDPTPQALIERTVAIAALAVGLLLAPLAGASVVLIPLLFGARWTDAAYAVAPACLALMIGAPISLATAGYLYAVGAVRMVLISVVLHTAAWFAVALPLLPVVGVPAVGIGWIAGSIVDAIVLMRAAHRRAGTRLVPGLGIPLGAAAVAGAAAFAVGHSLTPSASAVIFSLSIAIGVYVALLCAIAWFLPESRSGEASRALGFMARRVLTRRPPLGAVAS